MYSVYEAVKGAVKVCKIYALLCVLTFLSVFSFDAASAEESPPSETSTEEIKLEELEPEPLGDLFAIKLLEKIIELEDALKYLAKEVGTLKEELTEKVDKMDERITKLETAPPPAYTSRSGEPYTPPEPPQKRFEVGDIYLGSGFKAHDVVYETTDEGTTFSGEIEAVSTGAEEVEFEIIVYDEKDKMIGFTTFKFSDIDFGETRPFEATVKGPSAHWIKRYDMHYLRGS